MNPKSHEHLGDAVPPNDKERRRILRQLDWRIVSFCSVLYLCSFLDRSNIGNAKIAGIIEDLSMSEATFNWALSIFFIGYIIFEIPGNLLLKLIGPRKSLSLIMLIWAVIMAAMAAVTNGPGLLAARFFLGVAEAGLFPGIVFLMSIWYPRQNQSMRISMVWSASTIAGAFGGILAYGIMHMDGIQGMHGWQWIFVIEAIPTILAAIATFFWLPDYPETCNFLSLADQATLIRLLDHDSLAEERNFSWKQVIMAFIDWKIYAIGLIQILSVTCIYSYSLFLPSIIVGMGYSSINAQLMSAPPYAIACTVTLICSYTSDEYLERGFHIAGSCIIASVGYILLVKLRDHSTMALYIAAIITACGLFPMLSISVAWNTNNQGGHTKRAVAIGLIGSLGNIGGVISGQMYREDDAPGYIRGHTICAGLMGASCILTLLTKLGLYWENRRRDAMTDEEYTAACNIVDLCDKHPDFRYIH